MKVQKLGLALGVNIAVACLALQGCKAVKPNKNLPPPETIEIATEPAPDAPVPVRTSATRPLPPPPPPPPPPTARVKPLPPPPPPPAPVTKPAAPSADAVVHVVQRGELLSTISKKYNVRMPAIIAANPGLNPDRIRIGQKIAIPGTTASKATAAPSKETAAGRGALVAPAAPKATAAPAKEAVAAKPPAPKAKPAARYDGPTKEYVVRGGDSLGKIAVAHGLTVRALKDLNGLTKDIVRVGQKLKVPAAKADKAEAKKDAESKFFAKKDAAAEKKAEAKPAAPEPAPAAPAADAAKPAEEAAPVVEEPAPAPVVEEAPAPAANTYTVKEGDDLVSISISWGVSPSQLVDLNDLKEGEPLKPGQVLKLPGNARQSVQ